MKRGEGGHITVNFVIPDSILEEIPNGCHSGIAGGHQGSETTLQIFRRCFWNKREYSAVNEHAQRCMTCKRCNGKPSKDVCRSYPIPARAFKVIVMDLIGPLAITEDGSRFILPVNDFLTRFCILQALPNKSADAVARALSEKVFGIFGCPETLLSDNGRVFSNNIVKKLCSLYGVDQRFLAACHSASNGMVERNKANIIRVLRILIEENQSEWDTLLPEVAQALNGRYNKTLQNTLYYCLFGKDLSHPAAGELPCSTPFSISAEVLNGED